MTKSRLPPTTTHPDVSPFAAFAHAFSLVSTRAFLIDLYHTIALCPFADIANHSSSSHTSLASDDFVCHLCGSLAECSHDVANPATGTVDRLSHLDPTARRNVASNTDTVDMYVEWPLREGQEIINNYGDGIPESRLLVEWGFLPGASEEVDRAGDSDATSREDELLIEGATWSLAELCPEIVAQGWEQEQEAADIAYASAFEPSEGTLLCASSPKPIYHLNNGGQVSFRLFGAVWLDALRECRKRKKKKSKNKAAAVALDEPTDVQLLLKDVQDLEDVWTKQEGTLSPANARAAKTISKLLARRLLNMRRPDLGISELYDQREEAQGLSALALTIVVNEVALVESTLARWEELTALASLL